MAINHLHLGPLELFKGKIKKKNQTYDNRRVLILSCRLILLNQVNPISLMFIKDLFHSFNLPSLNLTVNSSGGMTEL